jgi:L-ascorbate metabolism protein UlaG (beta-lactamase superfamily)
MLVGLSACYVTKDNKKMEKETKIQFIRNATMKINYAGKTFLTDPYFSEKGSLAGFLDPTININPMQELPLTTDQIIEDIEFILVSHTHIPAQEAETAPSDHFDNVAIESLDKDFPIYVQYQDAMGLERVGFNNVKSVEGSIEIDNIKITRFDGKHVDIDALIPLIGESSGFVLEAENEPTILWTGDTLLTDEVKSAIANFNPDIIVTHSGGAYIPIDAEGNIAKLVLDDDDTVEIAKLAPNAKIIAIHIGALDHCPVTKDQLRAKAIEAGVSDRVFIPGNGEILEF